MRNVDDDDDDDDCADVTQETRARAFTGDSNDLIENSSEAVSATLLK